MVFRRPSCIFPIAACLFKLWHNPPKYINLKRNRTVSISLSQYFGYLQYMLGGIAMTAAFGAVYLRITPAEEIRLIKNGNLACALSFGGALAGFCIALTSSIAHSVGFFDFILWNIAAGAIQILVYFAATRIVKGADEELVNNNVAVGAFFCAISLGIGLLNAACLA